MTIMNPEGTLENKLEKLYVAYGSSIAHGSEEYLRFQLMRAKEIEDPQKRLEKYEQIADLWLAEPEKWNWRDQILDAVIEQVRTEKRGLQCGGSFVRYEANEPDKKDLIIVGVELYNSKYDDDWWNEEDED